MIFGHDISFWLAIVIATVVKLVTSPFHSFWRAVSTVLVAVFSAWAFTDAVLDWWSLDPDTYKIPMAASITLTGEGIMRMVMTATSDPKELKDWLRAWRGK